MTNKTVLSTSLLAALAFAGAVQAAPIPASNGLFFKPYAGADYEYINVNYEDNSDDLANDSLSGVNPHIGVRVHRNLGFELGYLWTADAKQSNVLGSGLDSKVNVSGFNLDALGYLPVDDAGRFELIGTVGVSHLRGEFTIPTVGSEHDSETKLRFGGGAQFWLTDNINARGLVRYQGADFDGAAKNAVTANVGVNLQF